MFGLGRRLNGSKKRIFTTVEAAEICKLPHKTIIRCFRNGKLRGYRAGRTGFLCIPRKELQRFMRLCGHR
jgi:excisionase family DNA binding protein